MSTVNIAAIVLGLTALAIVALALYLVREVLAQKGTTAKIESEILQTTSPWVVPVAVVSTVLLAVTIGCTITGAPVPIWSWVWIPGWLGSLYDQRQGKRASPPSRQSQDDHPKQPPQSGAKLADLVQLLNGDRVTAKRLIKTAGSVDRAITQLLRDRR